jgi:hypothetical protein
MFSAEVSAQQNTYRVDIGDSSITLYNKESNSVIWQKDENNWEKGKAKFFKGPPLYSKDLVLQKSNHLVVAGMDLGEYYNLINLQKKAKAEEDSIISNIKVDEKIKEENKGKIIDDLVLKNAIRRLALGGSPFNIYYFIFQLSNGALIKILPTTDNSQNAPINGSIQYISNEENFFILYYEKLSQIKVWDINSGLELNTLTLPVRLDWIHPHYSFRNDDKTLIIYYTDYVKENVLYTIDYLTGNQKKVELKNCPIPIIYGTVTFKEDLLYLTANDSEISEKHGYQKDPQKNYIIRVDINSGNVIDN